MCDTLGKLGTGRSFFAKNSDRSPNEIQIPEYRAAKQGLSGNVRCTYISIPQAEETYAVLLSRPSWMWGAEMGVNEFGLCIGNEAVFTKGPYGKTGLTGMDMVRLALERCQNSRQAVSLLIDLLETYGQGGNCGFDHKFYYDNAFLIMDRKELYVLQTAGKNWVYKRYDSANISNRLSIGWDGDAYAGSKHYDFAKQFTEPVYTTFSGSKKRQNRVAEFSIRGLADCMAALRSHSHGSSPFLKGSVDSPCMHFGGMVGDHTTASWAVSLEEGKTVVWLTGSSLPCVSLFKPWCFGTEAVLPVTAPESQEGRDYWLEAEDFRRKLIGKRLPKKFHNQLAAIQKKWLEQAESIAAEDFPAFSLACLQEEKEFYESWADFAFESAKVSSAFQKRWEEKNRVLEKKE